MPLITSTNQSRRALVKGAIAYPLLILAACASEPLTPEPIAVDVTNVTNVPDLIQAIKKAAGRQLPDSLKPEVFYAVFAKIFVENARVAAEKGYRVPKWILDRLPIRKVVVPLVIGTVPFLGLVQFSVGGVAFTVPTAGIITAVLGSIALMTVAIGSAIKAMIEASKGKI